MAATDEQTPNHTKDSLPIVSHGTFQKIPSVASLDSRKSHLDMSDINQTELRRVITGFSHRYSGSHEDVLPEFRTDHPTLDPKSPEFDIHQWLRAFIGSFQTTGVSNHKTSVIFKDLSVYGTGAALQVQQTVGTVISAPLRLGEFFSFAKPQPKRILHSFHGILKSGELLVVLGRPGSGCSTLLKTICGEMHGISLGEQSVVHYDGVPQQTMITEFKGEAAYNQEVDKHFPHLTVGQTLEFAASARTPSRRMKGMSRVEFSKHVTEVVMAVFGLSHAHNTKVGDDFVRGVSGGERKRVSIAEMVVAGVALAAWDNSTRGLDSATALKFVQSLRLAADTADSTHAVAIYQASQAIYEEFDKAVVLYEGREIFFGPAASAKEFFERQGWFCPLRQTTSDFLTSVTNPLERKPRTGMELKVPRTPAEFESYWHESAEFKALQADIAAHEQIYPPDSEGEGLDRLRQQKRDRQANHTRLGSPYTISIFMQVKLNTKRVYQRIWNDISATVTAVFVNIVLALIIGSIFYGTPDATAGFYSKGSALFNAILLNALSAISEINSLYSQRPIVEKHASYAFYHPATEAAAGIVGDIPIKFATATAFNLIMYFMSGLRREPGPFFLYFLVTFLTTFVMSAVFRTMAAVSKTISQAMALAGVLILAIVIYTGFVIAAPQMRPWFAWIRWINPVYYAFEILIANEFHGREFACSSIIPSYQPRSGNSWICSATGAIAGREIVRGDDFISLNYSYSYSHVWRNLGILIGYLVFFLAVYFVATELNSSTASAAEVLVFQHGHVPKEIQNGKEQFGPDTESASTPRGQANSSATNVEAIEPQRDVFTWRNLQYDIEIKGEPRRLLDDVAGWVKPGTLTALMGVSGAGKTTLLDVLAQRTSMGIITGDMFVSGRPQEPSFQRSTGYVQQQDLHLETATVRESLRFSATLRQPMSVSIEEKHKYVENVIKMLNMEDFANAVVGVPGQGLNVEQRKLLTIGVELAAKPKLLLFLDEPTSGLDSQSSWAICSFLRRIADAGQAVLCTVHQPSAILFQEFDRLLFLARGGKTVYFGDIGSNSQVLLEYFESHGARKCLPKENPAEYMLEVVNQRTNDQGEDWHSIWKSSKERQLVDSEIGRIHAEAQRDNIMAKDTIEAQGEFATPLTTQIKYVTYRIFQQYWRMPSYIFSKLVLGGAAGLFVGFTFYNADDSLAGMQNVLFCIFMLTTLFTTLVQQIQPLFISQRALYEVRERPSKAYSWKAFVMANIVVEVPWQILTAIVTFACYYYAIVGVQSSDRQVLVLLFTIQLFLFASTFAHMCIAALPDAQTASAVVTLLVLLSILFNGVLQAPSSLPRFWIFMYRVSPFTYWVGGIVATVLHDRSIVCSPNEFSTFDPADGQTCGQYLSTYLQNATGYLSNPEATQACRYCAYKVADQYLAGSSIFWSERWRNFGIMFAFIGFNVLVAVVTYYLFRIQKPSFAFLDRKKRAA